MDSSYFVVSYSHMYISFFSISVRLSSISAVFPDYVAGFLANKQTLPPYFVAHLTLPEINKYNISFAFTDMLGALVIEANFEESYKIPQHFIAIFLLARHVNIYTSDETRDLFAVRRFHDAATP